MTNNGRRYREYDESHIKLGDKIVYVPKKKNNLSGKRERIECWIDSIRDDKLIVKFDGAFCNDKDEITPKQWIHFCRLKGYRCIDRLGKPRKIWWFYSKREWNIFRKKLFSLTLTILISFLLPYGIILLFFNVDEPRSTPFFITSMACMFYGIYDNESEKGPLDWLIKMIYTVIALPALIGTCMLNAETNT